MTLLEAIVQERVPEAKLAAATIARANIAAVISELKLIHKEKHSPSLEPNLT